MDELLERYNERQVHLMQIDWVAWTIFQLNESLFQNAKVLAGAEGKQHGHPEWQPGKWVSETTQNGFFCIEAWFWVCMEIDLSKMTVGVKSLPSPIRRQICSFLHLNRFLQLFLKNFKWNSLTIDCLNCVRKLIHTRGRLSSSVSQCDDRKFFFCFITFVWLIICFRLQEPIDSPKTQTDNKKMDTEMWVKQLSIVVSTNCLSNIVSLLGNRFQIPKGKRSKSPCKSGRNWHQRQNGLGIVS